VVSGEHGRVGLVAEDVGNSYEVSRAEEHCGDLGRAVGGVAVDELARGRGVVRV
jgi:hypothetical protein